VPNSYLVRRAAGRPDLTGDARSGPWAAAEVARIEAFCWYRRGDRQGTEVRALYDEAALWLQFIAADRHIWAEPRELNGNVCLDSCVEFFASPDPAGRTDYFNFEANCCGALHLGWRPGRDGRRLIAADLARRIDVKASEPGDAKAESPDDDGWWLAARLGFDVLSALGGLDVGPRPDRPWRGNFYRCGGRTDPQFACWNPVPSPSPDFHRPDAFGHIRFAP
jgi:hypothetical protein